MVYYTYHHDNYTHIDRHARKLTVTKGDVVEVPTSLQITDLAINYLSPEKSVETKGRSAAGRSAV